MQAGPTTAEPSGHRATRDQEDARLMGIVRQLLAYGRDLVASLQGRNTTTPPLDVARRFCCVNLALIVTRITRGLLIAQALEARLIRRRAQPATMPAARPAPVIRQPDPDLDPGADPKPNPRPRRPRRTDADNDAELLGPLPSAQEIARRFRGRPIGSVIVEICRDLGIDTQHPLWREINKAILFHGGSMVRMLNHWVRGWPMLEQVAELAAASAAPLAPPPPIPPSAWATPPP